MKRAKQEAKSTKEPNKYNTSAKKRGTTRQIQRANKTESYI